MARLEDIVRRVRDSVWVPVLAKGAGLVLALVALGLVGAGALDGALDAPSALAASRSARSAASASASAAPGAASASASASASAPRPTAPPRARAITPDGKVVLNLATVEDLDRLPGIGAKKAEAIVALRERSGGRFKSLNDLMRVRGIKRRFLERLREHVVLDPPAAAPASAAPSARPAPSVGVLPPPSPVVSRRP